MYGQRTPPQEPPCQQCRVDLSGENEDAARVFMITRRQVITVGMGQVADISIPAVKVAMDLYGVKDQVSCLNQVRKLFHHFLEAQDEGQ
jgi:hypothetical protein